MLALKLLFVIFFTNYIQAEAILTHNFIADLIINQRISKNDLLILDLNNEENYALPPKLYFYIYLLNYEIAYLLF